MQKNNVGKIADLAFSFPLKPLQKDYELSLDVALQMKRCLVAIVTRRLLNRPAKCRPIISAK